MNNFNKFTSYCLKPVIRLRSKKLYNSLVAMIINNSVQCDLDVLTKSLMWLIDSAHNILNNPNLIGRVGLNTEIIEQIKSLSYSIVSEWVSAVDEFVGNSTTNNRLALNLFRKLLLSTTLSLCTIKINCRLLMENSDCSLRDFLLMVSAVDMVRLFSRIVNDRITCKITECISVLMISSNVSMDSLLSIDNISTNRGLIHCC
ncbi:hypothetical protein [Ehrlichia japonica]|nr:hypothetical protein [Ehrlichia japonica]